MKISRSSPIKYSKLCGLILGVLVVIFIVIYNTLPFLLESFLQRAVEKSGLGKFSCSIRGVSLTGFYLNSIAFGIPDKPYASVSSVTADYSLWALLRGEKGETLILRGVEINCSYDGKNIVFPGLDISKVIRKAEDSLELGNAKISAIEVKNSVLNINYCGKHLSIPFKLKYFPGKKWIDGYAELELTVREQQLNAKLTFDERSANGTVYIRSLDPDFFYDFLPAGSGFSSLLLSDISLDFTITDRGITGTAKANAQTPFLVSPEGKADTSIPLIFKYCTDFSGKWDATCNTHFDSIMLKSENMDFVFKNPVLFMSFSEFKESGSAKLILKSDLVSALFHSNPVSFKNISLCASTQFNKKEISGEVSFNASLIESPASQTAIKSLTISLPFNLLAAQETVKKGCFSMSDISVENINIGAVSGELQQIGRSIVFSAIAPSTILPDMAATFNGTCGINKDKVFETDIFFNVPKYKVTAPININKLIPAARGITYKGEYEIEGFIKLSPSKIDSNLKLNISNSSIEMKSNEHSASASGISLVLEIKDIFKFRGAPSQALKISKFSWGAITIEDIVILFHIENLKAILIENIHAKWCDGTISVQAIRINPSVKNYSPVIFCDRVSFSKILEQLNMGNADGDGTLNGTIPLNFKDGKIEFDNGFLYSAPGNSGKIKIEGGAIDSITKGIPKDNPQFTQLTLSQMALRDFDYEWVKLYLGTEGENVIAKIQIAGKPARALPFSYKEEYGGFVTTDDKSPSSVFQELKLDINIKLPFNKIMWYNDQMQKIIK